MLSLVGCADKLKLPVDQGGTTGSGDTAFVKINPSWDYAHGFDLSAPNDIIVGPDGLVYIADNGNDRVLVLDRSGIVQTFGCLSGIDSIAHPTGLAFDDRLNLFICNGGDTVFIWNRFLNNYGVTAVIEYALRDTISGDTIYTFDTSEMAQLTQNQTNPNEFWVLIGENAIEDPGVISEALAVTKFYVSPTSQFYCPAVDPIAGDVVYFTDPAKQHIYRVQAVINLVAICANGYVGYTYQAEPLGVAISYGTGIMTCDQPRGVTFDNQGFILFAQVGGNFKVQKIGQDNFAAFVNFGFADFSDIMLEGRFANPLDVTVGGGTGLGAGWIYVADTDSNRVQVFTAEGDFILNAGEGLGHPAGVASFDGVLYIADTDSNRIERYGLSSSGGVLPGGGQ
jgi:DNA-binding beta-propeller fold protein YncE